MHLTIFAASGGIGRQLLEQAIAAGHDVTAVVRNPSRVTTRARVIAADLSAPDPEALESAVAPAGAVLSALGARTSSDLGVAGTGTRAIVGAMYRTGVRRIVVVSAAPMGTVPSARRPHPPKYDPGDGFLMRHVFSPLTRTVLRRHYADLAEMEDVLRESRLDWTIVRPPRLTNRSLTARYRTAYGRNVPGMFVSRADVAHLMLRVLAHPEAIQQTVGIAA